MERRAALRELGRMALPLILALLASASVSAAEQAASVKPALSATQAIALARREAVRRGIDLSKFKAPTADFDAKLSPPRWWVTFMWDVKVPPPGGFFTVSVDDRTMDVYFFPGM